MTSEDGVSQYVTYETVSELREAYAGILKEHCPSRENQSADFHYRGADGIDWRGHIYHHIHGWSVCLKRLPSSISALKDLGFDPADFLSFIQRPGLSLFVGPIDAGKTTAMLATMQHLRGQEQLGETITIEQPVEYIFDSGEISQRRVGPDVVSHAQGVYDAVRESPRTIVIGEIRDRLSAQAAVRAGMLGHRVLTTLHGNDVVNGITKLSALLDTEHNEVIPEALSGVVAQHLLRGIESPHVMIYEALEVDKEARHVLLQGPAVYHQLENVFHSQKRKTLAQCAEELIARGVLTQEEANQCLK